jgi:hypothetical protein
MSWFLLMYDGLVCSSPSSLLFPRVLFIHTNTVYLISLLLASIDTIVTLHALLLL